MTEPQGEMRRLLHELCQPLTAVQCRLDLSLLDPTADHRQAIADALGECERMNEVVMKMRTHLVQDISKLGRV